MTDLHHNLTALIEANGGAQNLARKLNKEWCGFPNNRRIRYQIKVDNRLLQKYWNLLSLREISVLTNVPETELSKQGSRLGLPYKKHIFRKTPNQRDYNYFDIVNMQTGVFYGNMKEAARAAGMATRTMQGYLKGDRKNVTDFVILGRALHP